MQASDGESLAASSVRSLSRDAANFAEDTMALAEPEDSGEEYTLPESSSEALSMDVQSEPEAVDAAEFCRHEASLPWSMTWACQLLGALAELVPLADLKKTFLAQGRQTFFSTYCSGIGCPEIALLCLSRAAEVFGGFEVHVSCSSTCDIDSSCRLVLAKRLPGAHIFQDIFHHFPGWDRDPTLTPSEQVARLKAFYRPGAACPCSAHSQSCSQRPVDGHVLGSPCQPWSAYGRRWGHSDARTVRMDGQNVGRSAQMGST